MFDEVLIFLVISIGVIIVEVITENAVKLPTNILINFFIYFPLYIFYLDKYSIIRNLNFYLKSVTLNSYEILLFKPKIKIMDLIFLLWRKKLLITIIFKLGHEI